jgi:hypothetical protein
MPTGCGDEVGADKKGTGSIKVKKPLPTRMLHKKSCEVQLKEVTNMHTRGSAWSPVEWALWGSFPPRGLPPEEV